MLKTTTYKIHKELFSKANISRSQTLEVISAAYGFKSYAALKPKESQINEICFFLYSSPLMAMQDRFKSFKGDNISDVTLEKALNVIFSDDEYSYFHDEVELEESLTDSMSELHEMLEAELEEAASQSDGYAFEGAELTNSDIVNLPNGDLQLTVEMTASLSQVEGRMLSTSSNIYDLVARVKIPQISSTGFGFFEIISTEISSRNSIYDYDLEDGQ